MHNGKVNDYLNMKPFPQFISDPQDRKETWTKYRCEIIGSAGIALFFMGNKLENGKLVLANGMQEEFDIARAAGLAVVPVGASGYKAKELWDLVMEDVSNYYGASDEKLVSAINELGEEVDKPDQLIEKILNVIDLMSKE